MKESPNAAAAGSPDQLMLQTADEKKVKAESFRGSVSSL
jgi:hypothetical protein